MELEEKAAGGEAADPELTDCTEGVWQTADKTGSKYLSYVTVLFVIMSSI